MSFLLSLLNLFLKSDFFSKLLVMGLFIAGILLFIVFIYGLIRFAYKKKQAISLLESLKKNQLQAQIHNPLYSMLTHGGKKSREEEDLFFSLVFFFINKEVKMKLFFGISAAVAPLLGLLGTIWGIMHVFLSLQSSVDLATIAPGIAEALITTLAGLFVAIPGLIAYHIFGYLIKSYIQIVELIYQKQAVIKEEPML